MPGYSIWLYKSSSYRYFPGANVDDGSCCLVAGCTDPTASNYDPNACIDDGSCIIGTTCSGSPITNFGVRILFITELRSRSMTEQFNM